MNVCKISMPQVLWGTYESDTAWIAATSCWDDMAGDGVTKWWSGGESRLTLRWLEGNWWIICYEIKLESVECYNASLQSASKIEYIGRERQCRNKYCGIDDGRKRQAVSLHGSMLMFCDWAKSEYNVNGLIPILSVRPLQPSRLKSRNRYSADSCHSWICKSTWATDCQDHRRINATARCQNWFWLMGICFDTSLQNSASEVRW